MRLFRNKKTGKYHVICMDDTDNIELAINNVKQYSYLNINYEALLYHYNEVDSSEIIKALRKEKINKINDKNR
jgi:hypothetical protein